MKRNYPLLLTSQFLGAFGDNAILAVILGQLIALADRGQITVEQQRNANAIYTSLLFIPFVLLAPLAGYLNDRHPKTRWLLGGNALKFAGTVVCALSIWHGYVWQGIGYLIVGIGACVYSPAKYGILPEILPSDRLVKANGTVELLTLLAILGGNVVGAKLIDNLPVSTCYVVLLGIYGSSLLLNTFMQGTPANPQVHLATSLAEFKVNVLALCRSPRLSRVLVGTAVFWICGAVLKMNFQAWGLSVLGLTKNTQIAILLLYLSIGIMIGSVLAGQLHKVGDLRSTRIYGWILAALVAALGTIATATRHGLPNPTLAVHILLVLTGIAAGLFLIPLNASLQAESHPDSLGKTIATQNFIENIAMIGGGLFVLGSIKAGLSTSGVFVALALTLTVVITWLRIPPHAPSHTDSSQRPAA